jgi:hypothetical protein
VFEIDVYRIEPGLLRNQDDVGGPSLRKAKTEARNLAIDRCPSRLSNHARIVAN